MRTPYGKISIALDIVIPAQEEGLLSFKRPAPKDKPTPTTANWTRLSSAVPAPVTAAVDHAVSLVDSLVTRILAGEFSAKK